MQTEYKRIAIVTPRFPPEGGEDYSYHMARIAEDAGHDLTVHTIGTGAAIYKRILVSYYKPSVSFGEFAKLWFPDVRGYDIIHLCGGYRHPHMFWCWLTKGNAKFIISPFYPVKPRTNKLHSILQWLIDRTVGRYVLRHADIVLAETEREAEWLRSIGITRVALIPNPIEDKYLEQRDGSGFKLKHGIKGKMVFFLGGHTYIKNVSDLIEATPYIDAAFVIGGTGPLTEQYKKRLKELGTLDKVIFPGNFFDDPEEKFRAFAAADVFVLPSRFEGLGGVLIEAMAQGTPVIAANRGGVPDVVPSAFCLYELNDIRELAERVNRVLTDKDLADALIVRGLFKAHEYAMSVISRKYIGLLND